MSYRNERETYPNQGRRPDQEDYSNGITLLCFIALVLIIVINGLIEAYYPHLFDLIE